MTGAGADDENELKPINMGKRDFSTALGEVVQDSNHELDDMNTPVRIRKNGFHCDLRPYEVVWWEGGQRASVYLNITTNYSITATVSANGQSLIIQYTQKMVDPNFYIKPSSKTNILGCPESRAVLQYFQGKEPEIFTLSIPFGKKMLPGMEKRYISSTKGTYPSVSVFILTVAPNVEYGDAESCESI